MSADSPTDIRVQVRYFASLREALGEGEAVLVSSTTTAGALREQLAGRGGVHAEALGAGRAVRFARNQRMCSADQVLQEGDEFAFFPPVTGG
ncbi:MAG: molybdopterin converting factor subunit 1 [Rubrivivax sp.]